MKCGQVTSVLYKQIEINRQISEAKRSDALILLSVRRHEVKVQSEWTVRPELQ